ncbi:hypothetical protein Dimus_013745, partial [Dionaea muscipula]
DKFTELMEQQRPSDVKRVTREVNPQHARSRSVRCGVRPRWTKRWEILWLWITEASNASGLIGGASTSQPTSGPNVEVMSLMAQLMVSQLIAQTQQPTSSTPHQGAAPLTFQMQIPAEYLTSIFIPCSRISSRLLPSPPPPPHVVAPHVVADVESP